MIAFQSLDVTASGQERLHPQGGRPWWQIGLQLAAGPTCGHGCFSLFTSTRTWGQDSEPHCIANWIQLNSVLIKVELYRNHLASIAMLGAHSPFVELLPPSAQAHLNIASEWDWVSSLSAIDSWFDWHSHSLLAVICLLLSFCCPLFFFSNVNGVTESSPLHCNARTWFGERNRNRYQPGPESGSPTPHRVGDALPIGFAVPYVSWWQTNMVLWKTIWHNLAMTWMTGSVTETVIACLTLTLIATWTCVDRFTMFYFVNCWDRFCMKAQRPLVPKDRTKRNQTWSNRWLWFWLMLMDLDSMIQFKINFTSSI